MPDNSGVAVLDNYLDYKMLQRQASFLPCGHQADRR
jgi:hypothetical protein